ncbi:uncharacterized protein LOC108161561 isoform X2 [Drosophila miranda]|uniref:uncharacterized protein LOC108161561 isoform X2 n=1 Tax=Drosophila miranda TaxID=7229 RepID=UPI0007E5F220|nr:uncharacterized protein LOC108161561 isoform X2 [Drosophila miranda]
MSDETKRKYNDLAKNSAKTRVPGLTVQKLVQQILAQTSASAENITQEEPMVDGISDQAIQRRRPPTPYPSLTSITRTWNYR